MTKIALGTSSQGEVSLDLDLLLHGRMLIQGGSGSGKSRTLRRIMEQAAKKVQIILFDIEGEFASLREKYDFVLVGKGGDTPAECRSAALLAHRLLEIRASAILDLYEMKPSDRHRWTRLFLEAMLDAPKALWHPCLVAVDEAHIVCPEKGAGDSEASEAMIDLATRGRKRGYAALFATQRIGKLRKDAAAELTNVLVGGTFLDIDRKRAAEVLGVPKDEFRKFSDEIKVLEPGHFWALGRAVSKERILVKVGPVETTHPEIGRGKQAYVPPPPPDRVRTMLPKLEDLPKEAEQKAKNEAELRAEIRSLKAQIASRPKDVEVREKVVTKTVEVPVLRDQDVKSIGDAMLRAHERAMLEIRKILTAKAKSPTQVRRVQQEAVVRHMLKTAEQQHSQEGAGNLDKAQRKILTVLAQHPTGCEIGKLALLTGYRVSGGFKNALAALRSSGGIVGGNQETMRITHDAYARITGSYEPLPEGRALADYWLTHSSFGQCERAVLKALLECPDGLGIEELAERTGYQVSGGFKNALSSLRTAGVIVGRNTERMRVCDELLEAAVGA